MAYFDGIKPGDKVWSFEFGWGEVFNVDKENFVVEFNGPYYAIYNYDGKKCCCENCKNQTLFWGKIEFKIPEKPKIKLNECDYLIDLNDNTVDNDEDFVNYLIGDFSQKNGLFRDDKETAEKALKQIKKFTRLLALRDQICPNSRGYEFVEGECNWIVKYNPFRNEEPKWVTSWTKYYSPDRVYFKTEEDAQKICDILNSGRFDLEGE